MTTFGGRGIGTEVSWQVSDEVDVAFGISRQRRPFRLDDHNGVFDGVGGVFSF